MAFHDDLLKQAIQLIHKEPKNPKQASLRRAVSTAYYALFHLLISESVANWGRANMRAPLGRAFDHGTMKEASTRAENAQYPGANPQVVARLRLVGRAFRELQHERHKADYNNTITWDRVTALANVQQAQIAFATWKSIRNEDIAQTYLVSLLVRHRD